MPLDELGSLLHAALDELGSLLHDANPSCSGSAESPRTQGKGDASKAGDTVASKAGDGVASKAGLSDRRKANLGDISPVTPPVGLYLSLITY